jgi:hypothetical protein
MQPTRSAQFRRQIMYDLLVASVWSRVILDFFAHLMPGRRRVSR